MGCSDLLLVIVAVLFPPIPVAIRRGLCSADFFINVALCCLGFLPGLIHAFYIISKYPGVGDLGCRHSGYAPVNGTEHAFYGSSDLERAAGPSNPTEPRQQAPPPSAEYYTSADKKDNTNRPPPYSG